MTQRVACACCGYLPFRSKQEATFEICPVCGWQQDDVQEGDSSSRGGANKMSLDEARTSYRRIGAAAERFLPRVRAPRPEELPRMA